MKLSRKESLHRRHRRVRKDVNGSTARPRLAVFRSAQHIYAQIIDDTEQHTIAAASTVEPELKAKLKTGGNIAAATEVGKLVAERAKAKGPKHGHPSFCHRTQRRAPYNPRREKTG